MTGADGPLVTVPALAAEPADEPPPVVTAAREVLALALAGIPAALYVGSWSQWITDPARPVAAGSSDLNHGPDGRRL